MWLTIPSSFFMSLYIAQVDMSCELRTFMARHDSRTVVENKGYCHRPGTWLNFRSLADDAQTARVSADSLVVMRVHSAC